MKIEKKKEMGYKKLKHETEKKETKYSKQQNQQENGKYMK